MVFSQICSLLEFYFFHVELRVNLQGKKPDPTHIHQAFNLLCYLWAHMTQIFFGNRMALLNEGMANIGNSNDILQHDPIGDQIGMLHRFFYFIKIIR